jgi:hypothetical protein
MKRTTVEEYDNEGRLIKRTVTEEGIQVQPYVSPIIVQPYAPTTVIPPTAWGGLYPPTGSEMISTTCGSASIPM